LKKKEIFYWSPSLVNIATNQAVIRSAKSIAKYESNFSSHVINFFGEFQKYEKYIVESNIQLINFFKKKYFKYFPRHGFLKSRISFILIFILALYPLYKLLKKRKPEYLIIHLITSLPLTLLMLFNFETKFILRISGLPKLGFFRKLLWKLSLNKIAAITCPTEATKDYLISLKFVDNNKVFVLPDPIVDIEKITKLRDTNIKFSKETKFIFAAGRLTKQKNFSLMINAFKNIVKQHHDIKLFIAGEGEQLKSLNNQVKSLNLEDKIFFLGFQSNIFYLMKKSLCFISTSLWEDPGFVLIEAIYSRATVISSDCQNGPKEILMNGKGGYLFKSQDLKSLNETLNKFFYDLKNNNKEVLLKKINALKNIKKYSLFSHYLNLKKILEKI